MLPSDFKEFYKSSESLLSAREEAKHFHIYIDCVQRQNFKKGFLEKLESFHFSVKNLKYFSVVPHLMVFIYSLE